MEQLEKLMVTPRGALGVRTHVNGSATRKLHAERNVKLPRTGMQRLGFETTTLRAAQDTIKRSDSAFGSADARRPPPAPRSARAPAGMNSALRATANATRPTQSSALPPPATGTALRARIAEINSALRATAAATRPRQSSALPRQPSAPPPPAAHAALRARTAGINSALHATAAATRPTQPSAQPPGRPPPTLRSAHAPRK